MSKFRVKPEDFTWTMSPFDISAHVNKLIEEHEKKRMTRVYGKLINKSMLWANSEAAGLEFATHQALLYDVRGIEND